MLLHILSGKEIGSEMARLMGEEPSRISLLWLYDERLGSRFRISCGIHHVETERFEISALGMHIEKFSERYLEPVVHSMKMLKERA